MSQKNIITTFIMIFSLFQIGCADNFEQTSDGGAIVTNPNILLKGNVDGLFIDSSRCEGESYLDSDVDSLFLSIEPISPEQYVIVNPSTNLVVFVLNRFQKNKNLSLSSSYIRERNEILKENHQSCINGDVDKDSLVTVMSDAHMSNSIIESPGFARTPLVTPDYKHFKVNVTTNNYKCINSKMVKVADETHTVDLYKIEANVVSSLEDLRSKYQQFCSN